MSTKKILIIVLLSIVTVGSIATLYIVKKQKVEEPIVQEVYEENEQSKEKNEVVSEKQELANEGYDLIELDSHIEEDYEEDDDHNTSVDGQDSHVVTKEEMAVTKEGEIEIQLDLGNNSTEIIYDKTPEKPE